MAHRPAFFDTSVLLKRYLQEEGSILARDLLRRHRCIVSALGPVEALSALVRRLRFGEVSAKEYERVEARIDRDRTHWEVLDVDEQVIDRAKAVIRETSVRTLDAIHLASALGVQGYSRRRIPFITSDEHQREAAQVLGLEVVWVG